jgi:hypothetical protein
MFNEILENVNPQTAQEKTIGKRRNNRLGEFLGEAICL